MGMVNNPVMAGFYPDPSVCCVDRMDQDGNCKREYYMVHSTFCYSPGIPIFYSEDLCNWEQIGHVLTRKEQLRFTGASMSRGIYAPCIRYHKGTFYVACTNVSDGGNFYVTATDPKGPWSDLIYLKDAPGIDPSLFFDGDTCYYIGQRNKENAAYFGDCEIWIQELDLEKGRLTGLVSVLWDGAMKHAVWPEGPHIYKKGEYYYLLIAEGGTSASHSICVARSKNVRGPYEASPNNPVFTHRHLGNRAAVQNVGHADLIEHEDGSWYAFMLGTRPLNAVLNKGIYAKNSAAPLGRETFVAEVEWQEDWPVFNPGIGMLRECQQIGPSERGAIERKMNRTAAELRWSEPLDKRCVFFRCPETQFYQVQEGGAVQECGGSQADEAGQVCGETQASGGARLELRMSAADFGVPDSPAYIGVRITSLTYSMETRISCEEMTSGEAGLVYLYDEKNYVKLVLQRMASGKDAIGTEISEKEDGQSRNACSQYRAVLTLIEDSVETKIAEKEVPASCSLRFSLNGLLLEAYIDGEQLGDAVSVANLTSENTGGFVGCTMGVYAGGARNEGGENENAGGAQTGYSKNAGSSVMPETQPEYVYFSNLKIMA